jgi:NAD(P)-dependent dehydrogenase (short-subunit alcohol dehydrogenase family)
MPTALIVGASRGLGLAMVEEYLKRGWSVIATARGPSKGLDSLRDKAGARLAVESVDIVDQDQVAALRRRLDGRTLDLLFVNAGISNGHDDTVASVSTEDFIRTMVTNTLSPMRVVEAFEGLVPAGGTIGVMSSGLGSVADNDHGGWEVYRGSKAALNTLMRSFAARNKSDPRAMVIIAPGWVRTDMGGPQALLSIEESIPGVVDTLLAQAGRPGLRFLNYKGETVRW